FVQGRLDEILSSELGEASVDVEHDAELEMELNSEWAEAVSAGAANEWGVKPDAVTPMPELLEELDVGGGGIEIHLRPEDVTASEIAIEPDAPITSEVLVESKISVEPEVGVETHAVVEREVTFDFETGVEAEPRVAAVEVLV